MTDQELQRLKERLAELTDKYKASTEERWKTEYEIQELRKKIAKEERERKTLENIDCLKEIVRKRLDSIHRSKPTNQLWMVKINGQTFRSDKGKYTWTSEGRAIAAVSNYIDYHSYELPRGCETNRVVKELVKDGYITLIQVY